MMGDNNATVYDELYKYTKLNYGELYKQGPEAVKSFVKRVWSHEIPYDEHRKLFNFWFGVARGISIRGFPYSRILDGPPEGFDLPWGVINPAWAEIANLLYHNMVTVFRGNSRDNALYVWSNWKVEILISLDGEVDPKVANPDEVIELFLDNLPISIEEARKLTAMQRPELSSDASVTVSRVRRRARIVHKMVQWLKNSNKDFSHPRLPVLERWLQIFGFEQSDN